MEYYKIILVFGIYSFMGWYACTNTIKKIIKKIGIHRKYYPQNYIMPHRKIRKIFHLKKQEIPKWCCFELYMSFVYIMLFVISTLIFLFSNDKPLVGLVLFGIYVIITFLDAIHVLICSFLYR